MFSDEIWDLLFIDADCLIFFVDAIVSTWIIHFRFGSVLLSLLLSLPVPPRNVYCGSIKTLQKYTHPAVLELMLFVSDEDFDDDLFLVGMDVDGRGG